LRRVGLYVTHRTPAVFKKDASQRLYMSGPICLDLCRRPMHPHLPLPGQWPFRLRRARRRRASGPDPLGSSPASGCPVGHAILSRRERGGAAAPGWLMMPAAGAAARGPETAQALCKWRGRASVVGRHATKRHRRIAARRAAEPAPSVPIIAARPLPDKKPTRSGRMSQPLASGPARAMVILTSTRCSRRMAAR
jgi:hypothetical protein